MANGKCPQQALLESLGGLKHLEEVLILCIQRDQLATVALHSLPNGGGKKIKILGKHNLDLIGLSDTMEFIKMGETVKRISAPWESAAVRWAAAATRLFAFHSQRVKTSSSNGSISRRINFSKAS